MLITSWKTFLNVSYVLPFELNFCKNLFFFPDLKSHIDLQLILNWLPWQVLLASTAWLGMASTASEDPRDPPERLVTLARRDRRVSRATARQPCAWPPRRTPHPGYRRREQSRGPVSRRPSPQQGRDGEAGFSHWGQDRGPGCGRGPAAVAFTEKFSKQRQTSSPSIQPEFSCCLNDANVGPTRRPPQAPVWEEWGERTSL